MMNRPLADAVNAVIADVDLVSMSVDDLVAVISDCEAAIETLKTFRSLAELEALPSMPSKDRLVVENVGVFRVKRRSNRTSWQHRDVAHAVVDVAWRQGAINKPADVADQLLAAAGVSYWRTETLRQIGIDPNEYRVIERGPLCIVKETS